MESRNMVTTKQEEKESKIESLFLALIVGCGAAWLLIASAGYFSYWGAVKEENYLVLGQIGDSFGGVTSLISLFTLGVAFSVWQLQRKELRATQEALQNQYKEAERARHEERINEATLDYQRQLNSIAVPQNQLYGADALNHIWLREITSTLRDEIEHDLPTTDQSTLFGGQTIFAPIRILLEPGVDPLVAADAEWITARMTTTHDDLTPTEIAAQQLTLLWSRLYERRRHQIHPLLAVLTNVLETIEAYESVNMKQSRYVLRLRNHLSTTELNYVLAFLLFERHLLTNRLAELAEAVGLFADYEPGLDATEHILREIAMSVAAKKFAHRVLRRSAFE
jgi:hypothetical protein